MKPVMPPKYEWEDCESCGGEGLSGHDCGEDTCCCLYPEENIQCPMCLGAGGWEVKPDICSGDVRK